MHTNKVEHFCTLFDSNFLPMGMTLHQSLLTHAQPFHLWILCMDELVEQQLEMICLPHVTLIPLRDIETTELLAVKPGRSRGEYCWTITPFTFQAVFDRAPNVERVTYLDADLFFFDNPQILLRELDQSSKQVLITEHAYAPEYDRTFESGRFCVQFLTFRNTPSASKIMKWWQKRCLEWCFQRLEDGKFGDQKYLDSWLEIFPDEVQVVRQTEKTLAPWNVRFMENKLGGRLNPVFYHFHGLRIISPQKVRLYFKYRIGKKGLHFYSLYYTNLLVIINTMKSLNMKIPFIALPQESWSLIRMIKRLIFQEIKLRKIA